MTLTLLCFWRKIVVVKGTRASLATLCSPGITMRVRMQCSELTRKELDLVLLGQISALLSSDQDTNAKRPLPQQRSNMAFYHGGVRICRITFQKLHRIGTMKSEHTHTRHLHPPTHTHAHTHTRTHTHAHTHTRAHTHTHRTFTCSTNF